MHNYVGIDDLPKVSSAFNSLSSFSCQTFYIRLVGDLEVNTFGDKSYRKDRLQLRWIRNRANRRDFFVEGVYRGRFQPEYAGKVLLHRLTVHAGTINKGSGRQFTLNNLESILGSVVSSSKLVIPKVRWGFCVCLSVGRFGLQYFVQTRLFLMTGLSLSLPLGYTEYETSYSCAKFDWS